MSVSYIVKFNNSTLSTLYDNTSQGNNTSIDGFVELSKSKTNIPIIHIRTHKDPLDKSNETLLYKFMTNNFATFNFDDNTFTCVLNHTDLNSSDVYTSTIIFDNSSSSAYFNFKKNFEEYYNTKYESEYYPGGNIMYCGEVLYINPDTQLDNKPDNKLDNKPENIKEPKSIEIQRVPSGKGTMYYDLPGNKIKYEGDFELGLYDGSGTFYSTDGSISLVALNISSGVPTQKGKLNIRLPGNKKETIDIKFTDMWGKLRLTEKFQKQNYILSDNFVFDLAKYYWTNTEISLDSIVFQNKSLDDKYYELWKLIKNQEQMLYELNNNQLNNIGRMRQLSKYLCAAFGLIIFTIILVVLLSN